MKTSSWARRHLVIGWLFLCVFACAGTTLEALHGFKVAAYLDVGNETRRLMWRLAHVHGALIALLHIAWGLTLTTLLTAKQPSPWTSRLLSVALILLPAGFFGGGVVLFGGDPGPFIFLVPPGAFALVTALATATWTIWRALPDGDLSA